MLSARNRSWWQILLLVSGFIAATQAMATPDNRRMRRSFNSKLSNTCLSPECQHTSLEVLGKMNIGTDPCQDFYQFACGKFISETQIPDGKREVSFDTILSDKISEQLQDIISEEIPDSEPKYIRLPNTLYRACMNETLIESLGTAPMQEFSRRLGGWPVVVGNSWDDNNTWTWQETLKKFRRLGFNTDYIFGFGVTADPRYKTKHIIVMKEPSFLLNRKYLNGTRKDNITQAYYNAIIETAVLFGAKKENASEEIKESFKFEMELAEIPLRNQNILGLHNFLSIKEMQNRYPYVEWLDYINAFLPENITVDENEIIFVRVPTFFDELGKLLNRTDKRVIANYVMWRMHASWLLSLPNNFINKQVPSFAASRGGPGGMTKSVKCLFEASRLHFAMRGLYVHKYFKQDVKNEALEMFNNIRGAFSQILDETAWMDDDTKQAAKQKLQSMGAFLVYSNDSLNNDKFEEYYKKLEIDPKKYFESQLNRTVFEMDKELSQLRSPRKMMDWENEILRQGLDVFYSLNRNTLVLLAATWQGNFFNIQRPRYMNYGAIGALIGHEIVHGYDDEGSMFDGNGSFVNWWQRGTRIKFLRKVKCISHQYGNYMDKQTGLNLNGIKTQTENIADNAGIKISYNAYNNWAAKNGQEPRLPNLDYSPQQMFWISYAQSYCAKYTTEYLKDIIAIDEHAPAEFRVLGPLRNMKDFSRDFQCPVGSPMNPVHKCELW